MQFDSTVTISVILALVAVVVPVIGTIISSIHDTKIRKMEIEEQRIVTFEIHKRELLEQAISDLAKFSVNPSSENQSKMSLSLSKTFSYLADDVYPTALSLLDTKNFSVEARAELAEGVISSLRGSLQTITKPGKPR